MNLSESNPVEVSEECALFVKLYLNLYKLRTSEYIVSLTKTFALEGCLNSCLFENQTFYLTYPIDFPLKINLTRKYRPFFS